MTNQLAQAVAFTKKLRACGCATCLDAADVIDGLVQMLEETPEPLLLDARSRRRTT